MILKKNMPKRPKVVLFVEQGLLDHCTSGSSRVRGWNRVRLRLETQKRAGAVCDQELLAWQHKVNKGCWHGSSKRRYFK